MSIADRKSVTLDFALLPARDERRQYRGGR